MILSKEQINRYLRHIIMPEISGLGQKKLLESTVFIYGETVKDVSPMLYYLSASGIGHILCHFHDSSGYENLFSNIRDLNDNVQITLINNESWLKSTHEYTNDEALTFRILLCSPGHMTSNFDILQNIKITNRYIPTIISLAGQWRAIVKTLTTQRELESFMKTLSRYPCISNNHTIPGLHEVYGRIFSSCLSGTISAIEGIKLCLNIGTPLKNLLYFDLLSMEFSKAEDDKENLYINKLTDIESTHQVKKLSESSVLIVGTGGLGSPAAYALTLAGVGTLGLVDYDSVEVSNLNRQILHSASRIGMPKVKSAEIFLKQLNPDINLVTYNTNFNKENALTIVGDYDIVIDGVDNFPARYLMNDACFFTKKPMIEAGVIRFDGLGMTILPGKSSCYRCIFPKLPSPGSVPSCSEAGVLGPVPGLIGFIQAAEAVKLLTGIGTLLNDRLLYFDVLDFDFFIASLDRKNDCSLCGDNPSINELIEYKFVCESTDK